MRVVVRKQQDIYEPITVSMNWRGESVVATCEDSENALNLSEENGKYRDCSRPYNCGKLKNIYYPFWDGIIRPQYCGGGDQFKLLCDDDKDTWIHLDSQDFLVHRIYPFNHTMKMERKDLVIDDCSPDSTNTSLDSTLFHYTQNVHNITIFFNCSSAVSINARIFPCTTMGEEKAFYVDDEDLARFLPQLCDCERRIQVQVSTNIGSEYVLKKALSDGFEVKYIADFKGCKQCVNNKGACGINASHQFACYPPGGSQSAAQDVRQNPNILCPTLGHSLPPVSQNQSLDWNRDQMSPRDDSSRTKDLVCSGLKSQT
ncbi:hypothetical protein VNO77_33106 [Canavalia gladiata]|uniref:non-specific serine/threonine protein kinase n=1 Tax=Canavalia gladiata TaxID=3824 RepID=A0AAN9KBS0_CANGL